MSEQRASQLGLEEEIVIVEVDEVARAEEREEKHAPGLKFEGKDDMKPWYLMGTSQRANQGSMGARNIFVNLSRLKYTAWTTASA